MEKPRPYKRLTPVEEQKIYRKAIRALYEDGMVSKIYDKAEVQFKQKDRYIKYREGGAEWTDEGGTRDTVFAISQDHPRGSTKGTPWFYIWSVSVPDISMEVNYNALRIKGGGNGNPARWRFQKNIRFDEDDRMFTTVGTRHYSKNEIPRHWFGKSGVVTKDNYVDVYNDIPGEYEIIYKAYNRDIAEKALEIEPRLVRERCCMGNYDLTISEDLCWETYRDPQEATCDVMMQKYCLGEGVGTDICSCLDNTFNIVPGDSLKAAASNKPMCFSNVCQNTGYATAALLRSKSTCPDTICIQDITQNAISGGMIDSNMISQDCGGGNAVGGGGETIGDTPKMPTLADILKSSEDGGLMSPLVIGLLIFVAVIVFALITYAIFGGRSKPVPYPMYGPQYRPYPVA